jgi:hypothetical protein
MTLDETTMRELADRVAIRVVELLGERPPSGARMVTVAELARDLRVSPDTVYRHQLALGVVKVGGALRFDLAAARAAWTARCASSTSDERTEPATPRNAGGRPRRQTGTGVDLLPIRAQVAA